LFNARSESQALTSNRPSELALEEEQEFRFEFSVFPQATQLTLLFNASHESHEPQALASIQIIELALEEEQDCILKFPVVQQTIQRNHLSSAGRELTLLASNQPPELVLKGDQEFSLKSHVVQETAQRNRSPSPSYEVTLLTCNKPSRHALDEEQESVHVSLKRPLRSFDNVQKPRALNTPKGELFSSIPKECVRPSNIEGKRGRAVRCARRNGKISCILVLFILSIMGMAQALTDCQIMRDWIPSIFNETSCCEQLELSDEITCIAGRITQM
jgi:hypothetical protein